MVPQQVPALMCDQAAFDDLKKRVAVLSAFAGVTYDQFFGADYEVLTGTRNDPDGGEKQVFCRLEQDGEPVLSYDPGNLP